MIIQLINRSGYAITAHVGRSGRTQFYDLLLGQEWSSDEGLYDYIYVSGPGGTRWDIDLFDRGTFVWTGPVWDQQMHRE